MAIRLNLSKRMFVKYWMNLPAPYRTGWVTGRAWNTLYFDTICGNIEGEICEWSGW